MRLRTFQTIGKNVARGAAAGLLKHLGAASSVKVVRTLYHESSAGTQTMASDSAVASNMLYHNKMSYLRERIIKDPRFRMPLSEYRDMCSDNDVGTEDQDVFLRSLHNAGLILYYPFRAPDYIYLKPRTVTRELLALLDPDGSISNALVSSKATQLEEYQTEFKAMDAQKKEYDTIAKKKAHRLAWYTVGGVIVQGGVMIRLIWWDLSWDVMEPVSYLMTFSWLTSGWAVYNLMEADIAEYGTMASRYERRQQLKLYKANNFDEDRYFKLEQKILEHKQALKSYGVVVDKNPAKSYPLPINNIAPVDLLTHTVEQPQKTVESHT